MAKTRNTYTKFSFTYVVGDTERVCNVTTFTGMNGAMRAFKALHGEDTAIKSITSAS